MISPTAALRPQLIWASDVVHSVVFEAPDPVDPRRRTGPFKLSATEREVAMKRMLLGTAFFLAALLCADTALAHYPIRIAVPRPPLYRAAPLIRPIYLHPYAVRMPPYYGFRPYGQQLLRAQSGAWINLSTGHGYMRIGGSLIGW